MLSWCVCCRRSPRLLDWASYSRPRDTVHPAKPQPSGRFDPGRSSDASLGEVEDVAPGDDGTPASCCSIPVSDEGAPVPDEEPSVPDDGAPAPGEDTPAPVDDVPAAVVDDSFSSRRFLAYCSSLSRMYTRWRSISATVSTSGVLSWVRARWRSVATTAVLLRRVVTAP